MSETLPRALADTGNPFDAFDEPTANPFDAFDEPPPPTRAEAEAEFPMPQRFQRRPAETVGPALLKPKVQGLPPEERAGPSPYDQRTTGQNLAGAVRRGFEGQVVQPSAANAMDALDRQRRAMDAIDAGQTVDPADDPMGYGTSDASARSMIRDSVLQQMGATMGAFQESRRTAQAIPQNPRLRTMAEQIDAGQYAPAARTFLSDPGGITGQVMAESAPSILPQAVLGPASAVMGAGRGARVLWNAIGAYMGDQPARGIEILDDVMRQANVSPDDPDAMMRFIRDNPGVIGNAFRRAGLGSTGLALVSGLTAGASRPLRPAGGIRGNAASIGVNLGASLVGEPSGEAVAQGITYGEIKSPSDVALEAIGGVPMAGVNTAQETIAAARQPAQVAPAPSQPPRPPEAPPSAPAGLPPAGVAEAPPLPAAPQPGVSSPQTAGPSAQEAGAAPIPAPPPLPPMPPPPQTLAQIQAEQSVSSPEAARIRQAQEDAFIAWHDENMPGADVVMVAPGDPTPDGAVMRAELQRALAEPPVSQAPAPDVTALPPAPAETAVYPAPDVTTPAPDVTEPTAPIYALPPTPVAVEEPEPASPADPPPIPQPSPGSRRRPQRVQQAEDVGQAAARVADPTDAQKAAGNYEKGHISVGGLPVTIESPAGSERSGTAPDGTRWTSMLGADYGYIKRTKGADGDQVDVFLGPDVGEAAKRPVYVIDQLTTGDVVKFDEHKAMVGFPSEEAARAAYLASFSDNAGTDRIGAITKMDWPQFKRWARSGDTAKPLSYKPPKIQTKKPARMQKGPLSLLQFLASKGGLAPHGDLRAMDAHKKVIFGVGGPKSLVSRKGLSLDAAREAAEEAGYIGTGAQDYSTSDINALLSAIDAELRGNKVFSTFQAGDAEASRREEAGAVEQGRRGAAEAEVNAIALVLGANPSEQETADAVRLVMGGMDPEDALAEDRKAAAPSPGRPTQQAPGGMFGPVGQTDLVAATSASYGNVAAPDEAALTEAFRKRIAERGDFQLPQAMRLAGQLLGSPVLPGSRAARTVESALQAARSDEAPFAIAPRVSPQGAALAAGARNMERRGDVRRGAEAILDRLRMQQNLDRAAAQRGAREGRAGVRSVTDPAAIREVDQFIQWLGEHMVRDVGLRFSNQTSGAYGMFEVGPRIVTIFRRAIDSDNLDRTMVHELWHAMESALPSDDRAAVRAEYLRARDAWLGKNEWARPFLSGDQMLDQMTGDDAQAWLDAYPDRADMPVVVDAVDGKPRVRMGWNNETYRFRDRHEYFAETMADRYFDHRDIQDAKARSIFAHIRDIFRRMVAALKRLFGRDATGRIFDGFDRRQFQPPSAIQQWLRDETMYGALDDIRAVRQDAFLSEVRFARAPIAQMAMPMAPTATFNSPPESRLDSFIYEIQNKQIDLKRMQEAIERAGRTIGLPENAYLAEELYHGRTAKRTQDFINEELRPLLQDMVRRGVTMDELQKFLHARHAEEYNNHVASRDPNRPDGGSGMLTADARAILAGFPQDKLLNLSALAQQVDAITRSTRRTLVQYGMEPQERIDAWEQMFPYYVPLNREDMDTIYGGGAGTGQGYSVRGEFSRPALGSDRDVANIIASIALQRERAIVRGEKNIVANAVIELARRNPNPDVWEVNRPTRIRVLEGGQVVSKVDPNYKGRDNVIVARSLATSGPGAGRTIIERTLTLKPENERAMRMARAIKNLDMDDLGHLAPVASATRLMASLATQFNPVFGISNIIRDVQEAAINLSSTPLAGKQKQVLAYVIPALKGVYGDLRTIRRGGTANTVWGRRFEQLSALGGTTGFRDLWQTNEDRAKAIRSEINRVTEGRAKQFGRAVFGWLSDYNEALENSVRLAVFQVALDSGLSEAEAASIAKNITVNFNRKGAATTQIAALYAFFNAATQGTTRALKTLAGPAGRKIIAGGVLLGSMQALMLAGAGFSDEDIPEFIREKNLVIPIGGKRYLTIPMPLGFSVLPNIGRISTEIALGGGKDAGKKAAKLLSVVMSSYNPLGGSSTPLQMLMPTVADPIAAVSENKDFTGRPIARENPDSTTPKPGHALKKDVASIWSEYVSRALNQMTGGSEFQAGMFSPSPDHIDYLVGQFAGGFVREVNKALTAGVATYRGDDVPPNKIPLVGRFYGNAEGPNAVRTAYFENVKRLNGHELEIKGRAGRGGDVTGYIAKNPEAGMAIPANREINAIANMQRARRQMEAQGIPRERLRALDEQIAERMKRFNDMVKQAEKGR